MKYWLACAMSMMGVVACAPVPEAEMPLPPVRTRQPPQRQPLPPAPSDMPEIVYASASDVSATETPLADRAW